jgi:hypothetical protein
MIAQMQAKLLKEKQAKEKVSVVQVYPAHIMSANDSHQIIIKCQNLFSLSLGVDSEYFVTFTGQNIQWVMFHSL